MGTSALVITLEGSIKMKQFSLVLLLVPLSLSVAQEPGYTWRKKISTRKKNSTSNCQTTYVTEYETVTEPQCSTVVVTEYQTQLEKKCEAKMRTSYQAKTEQRCSTKLETTYEAKVEKKCLTKTVNKQEVQTERQCTAEQELDCTQGTKQ